MSIKALNSIIKILNKHNANIHVEDGQIVLHVPGLDPDSAVLAIDYKLGHRLPPEPALVLSAVEAPAWAMAVTETPSIETPSI